MWKVNGMQDFVIVNGRKLKRGYTTGSCAAAASKAAVTMLLTGKPLGMVGIDTPKGLRLELLVEDISINKDNASCSVIKDGGDDPDATSGLKIFARAELAGGKDIIVDAGEGIGRVTLPGLKVEVGKPAINPVPMGMIIKEVRKAAGEDTGIRITLWVPGGNDVARKTFNPRLGIVGGISILGTTGIVNPMSEDAWKEALALELKMLSCRGGKNAVFVFGNYGEGFVRNRLGIKENIIIISNFLGFMLDKAVEHGIERVLLAGHMGKLVKVSAGIFNTHSRTADARLEILAGYSALEGAPQEMVKKIYEAGTTDAAASIIKEAGLDGVFDRITENAARRCEEYAFNRIKTGAVLFNEKDTLLSMDSRAEKDLRI